MSKNLVGARFIAYLTDVFVVGIIYMVLSAMLGDTGLYFVPLMVFLYEPIVMLAFGNTVGKSMMNLKVVSSDGDKVSAGQIIGRWLSRYLSQILYIGYIIALFTKENQALHDILANTKVVEK